MNDEELLGQFRRAVGDLHTSRQRVRELERRQSEPVAVVGMACHLPGAVDSPDQLWDLLVAGGDAITPFPTDRGWDLEGLYDPDPDSIGRTYVREGGFLADIAGFDAEFFGINPREALAMDPQQRLVLHTSWEALEHAGVDPLALRGSRTGVFVGTNMQDYTHLLDRGTDADEGYLTTGRAISVVSGRLAYVLGLEGPALSVDTACSSSLVATHLAMQSLRSGESDLALAGGVAVLSTPGAFVEFARQRGLAPDGRCKSFAAAADGTAWSEGVAVLVLERLSDALARGHRVWAVLRGSAVNSDGASNGLSAPHGPSQQRVIRDALTGAGLTAADVDVVEAHGTGTPLGDPIEAQALLATYGQAHDDERPLWLGSMKSNVGHMQAAAGAAAVIKMAMALHHGVLPETLHLDEPTPNVDWSAGAVRLLRSSRPWPQDGRPRRAGVSGFGVSGTNAHLIVEQPPTPPAVEEPEQASGVPVVWPVSAPSEGGLRAQAATLAAWVREHPDARVPDIARSLGVTRSHFAHRAALVGTDHAELLEGLDRLAAGDPSPQTAVGRTGEGGTLWVFPGQGGQWPGMAADLLDESPVFAAAMQECDAALTPHTGWSLVELVRTRAPLDQVDVVQPALFAVMVSLARLWLWAGARPDAVVGHSQGEIAAAVVAGALSVEDGARVVALRSRALRTVAGPGGMASVAASPQTVADWLARVDGGVVVAAVNGPTAVVVAGATDAVDAVVALAVAAGVRARRIEVDYAAHSAAVEPVRDRLSAELATITPRRASTPFHSTVTGTVMDTRELDAEYWYRNLREPVRFAQTCAALGRSGHQTAIEVSPHPVLQGGLADSLGEGLGEGAATATVHGTLRAGEGGMPRFLLALAEAYVAGATVDWSALFPGAGRVALPTYAFRPQRFWPRRSANGGTDLRSAGLSSAGHPLLGAAIALADGQGLALTGRLSADSLGGDRSTDTGWSLAPEAVFIELALHAGSLAGCPRIEELTVRRPLALPADGDLELQIRVSGDRRPVVAIHTRTAESAPWVCHADGYLGPAESGEPPAIDGPWPPEDAAETSVPAGGPVQRAWHASGAICAEVTLDEAIGDATGFGLHPALLDAALTPWLATTDGEAGSPVALVWHGVTLHAVGATALRARISPTGPGVCALRLDDRSGRVVATADAVTVGRRSAEELAAAAPAHPRTGALLHRTWSRADPAGAAVSGQWAVLGEDAPAGVCSWTDIDALCAALDAGEQAPSLVLAAMPVPKAADLPDAVLETTATALALVQSWLADDRLDGSQLAVVTRAAVAARDDDTPDPAAAAVWGLLGSAEAEHPGRFVVLDTDGDISGAGCWSTLADAVADGHPQLALRGGTVYRPALTAVAAQAGSDVPVPDAVERSWAPDGSVLITGGLGTLGAALARHLITTHGIRCLILTSRRGADTPGADALRAELTALGARIEIEPCDVADRDAVAALLARVPNEHPLTAVVHAAGALDDGVVEAITPERLARVIAPKVAGAWHLHELTREHDLAAFVLFSSVSGVLGRPGQANYAAANTALDALAVARHASGLPALALAWGQWDTTSALTATLSEADHARLRRAGLRALPTDRGLALFDVACAGSQSAVVPVDLDRAALRELAAADALPPLLGGMVPGVRRNVGRTIPSGGPAGDLHDQLAGRPATEQRQRLLDLVTSEAAAALGHGDITAVAADRAFSALGFDSLTAVDLRNRLLRRTGLRLPSTVVFDHPTPAALAEMLLGELIGHAPEPAPTVSAQSPSGAGSDEPIAIVGLACRFPGGVSSPDELWQLIEGGGDAVGPFPTDRGWDLAGLFDPDPDAVGTCYTRHGGFLDDVAGFDAGFFGISPREALAMDPQQRLLLEVSWEALEHAGIDPSGLGGSRTGVFAGVAAHDYDNLVEPRSAMDEGYWTTGRAGSVVSGRVSYQLGLEGPAVSVDTACSSSLVALHLAAQSLRSGDCDLALAGGVTIMATPASFVAFARQRGLSTDGRCKAFAEAADGTGWGEGVGVLVLARLSEARARGHRVLALLRGSAINQDGASNGLSAPNGPSQQRVITRALASAQLSTGDVDVVEAHGTGTTLGDPIEAQALLATYGQDRGARHPLWLGSVKSNIGHTQTAAGVAGVIKMVLALQHGLLPATLHVDVPSSHVEWESGAVRLLTEAQSWVRGSRVRRAGVSAFGVSGTNAHVIIEEAPAVEPVEAGGSGMSGPVVWPLSAATAVGVGRQAARLARWVRARPGVPVVDVAWSLGESRAALGYRAVVVGSGVGELLAGLDGLVAGGQATKADVGSGVVWVFPGQGGQWVGMGAVLLAESAVFAAVIAECEAAFGDDVEWSLSEVLRTGVGLDRVDVVQPALFAVMVALGRLWGSCGVAPDAVVGHSQGEIAAAVVAGGLSLVDGARVVVRRSRALLAVAGDAGMVSITAPLETVVPLLPDDVSVAAVNGPESVVVSGPSAALDVVVGVLTERGVWARRIEVDYAAHSAAVEPLRERLLAELGELAPTSGEIPFYSTVTGGLVDTVELDAGYWYRNLRETVRFEDTVRGLVEGGHRTLIEVSPHPVLGLGMQSTLEALEVPEAVVLDTLRRDEGGLSRFLGAVGKAYAHGVAVDWAALYPDAHPVSLPTYAFEHHHYWPAAVADDLGTAGLNSGGHPLLGAVITLADGLGTVFTGRLSPDTHPWLADHAVFGQALLPGTGFVELVRHAGWYLGVPRLDEMTLEQPLLLPEHGEVSIQIRVDAVSDDMADGCRRFSVHSAAPAPQADDLPVWTRHASGVLAEAGSATEVPAALRGSWPPAGATSVPVEDGYRELATHGYTYGPAFRGVEALWRNGSEVYAEVSLPVSGDGYGVHPALLDAALHALLLAEPPGAHAVLPFAWTGATVHATGATSLRVRLHHGDSGVALEATDENGRLVISIDGVSTREVTAGHIAAGAGGPGSLLELVWSPAEAVPGPEPTVVFLDGATDGGAETLPERTGDLSALCAALDAGRTAPDAAVLTVGAKTGDTVGHAHRTVVATAALLRKWLAEPRLAGTRLVVCTRRAVAIDRHERPDPGAATVWGLLRSTQTEQPGRFVLLDTDGQVAPPVGAVLRAGVPQAAVRGDVVLAPSLRPTAPAALPPAEQAWRLEATSTGRYDDVVPVPDERATRALGAGEIRVEARAAGVNFHDVLLVLGAIDRREGERLGSEAAGVVVEVAKDVTDLAVGDRVVCVVEGAFGTQLIADRRQVVAIPDTLSFTDAAAVPIAYLTAYHALIELGGVGPGTAVLVHSAAGGVGLAAVRLAQWVGAEVFATAHPHKWRLLREAGVEPDHIASSRDGDFEETFRAQRDGRGIDVVINSLAGDLVDASLRLITSGGRFVELGLTDVRDAEQVRREHDVRYRRSFVLGEGTERIGELLALVVGLVGDRTVERLPVSVWPALDAPEAFRFMGQGRHVGKVVLAFQRPIDPDGTVLITGGTGTLGAAVARHVTQVWGVRSLVLLSRRGEAAPGVPGLMAELTGAGVRVRVHAGDVSDRDVVAAALAAVPVDAPLTVVVHAAAVLDDGIIEHLDADRIHPVLAPKVDGAWHLHELTRDHDLAAFVLFAAASAVLGGAGQANYAAANMFLDALAACRQADGLPAQSLAWGLWQETSELTAGLDTAGRARLRRIGLAPLPTERGLALWEAARVTGRANLAPIATDRAALRAGAKTGDLPFLLRGAVRVAPPALAGSAGLATRLAGLPASERMDVLRAVLAAEAATVLGYSDSAAIDHGRAFSELGFDSLSAVELRNRLAAAIGLRLPVTIVFDHPTVRSLAAHVLDQLSSAPAVERSVAPTTPTRTVDVGDDQHRDDPVVIVGMGCRFPGGISSPADLWDLVAAGRDAIGGFPLDRGWDLAELFDDDPDAVGRTYAHEGGFLDDVAGFDAPFFGINAREALAMDPQQRQLLETTWEALEHAGIDPAALAGSQTGVFAGLNIQDYPGAASTGTAVDEGYAATSRANSVVSGRVAYTLGLHGPAVTVDTACSSSLVALHLAAQALRAGECGMALAGGVTVMATPEMFVTFARQRGLAADGRCKSYGAGADGTGWGEGVGVVVLERLSAARAAGHRVWAVLRGSAVNSDGASNGLTAPNGPAQQRVIGQALATAGLGAADIDVVEGHGTGTVLGDPIEVAALLATYGQHRVDRPLWLGSIKSNIGHTQAASGMAGVIKMALAFDRETLPATLHAEHPSPHVDWESGSVRLLTESVAWPRDGHGRRAAVSSFGVSGTNAHVVLEEPPQAPSPAGDGPDGGILPLSGRTTAALRRQAARLAAWVRADERVDLARLAPALSRTRTQHPVRAAVLGIGRAELLAGLDLLAADGEGPGVVTDTVTAGKTAFVFPGQGAQTPGMGRELYAAYPAFAAAFDEICAEFGRHGEPDLRAVVFDPQAPLLRDPAHLQAALFAVEVAAARLLMDLGLRPDAVVGHSIGEIAAMHIAGVLSLADSCALVAARGRLMGALPESGLMLAVEATEEEIAVSLAGRTSSVDLAGVNGPRAVVVSGDRASVLEIAEHWRARGRRTTLLDVPRAFHSPHLDGDLDGLAEEFRAVAASLRHGDPALALASTVTGRLVGPGEITADYWPRHARRTVRFADGVAALRAAGFSRFVEVAPGGALTALIGEHEDVTAVALRAGEDEVASARGVLATAHTTGATLDWGRVTNGVAALRGVLPTYPFEHERYWVPPARPTAAAPTAAAPTAAAPAAVGLDAVGHPLLGAAVGLADGQGLVLTGVLSLAAHPWLADHTVLGAAVVPGTALLEMAMEAGRRTGTPHVEELIIEQPLVLPDGVVVRVQLQVGPDRDGSREIGVYSSRQDAGRDGMAGWTRHANGVLSAASAVEPVTDDRAWPPAGAVAVDIATVYDDFADRGLRYGPVFRGLSAAWRRGEDTFADVVLPDSVVEDAARYGCHPALFDAALHAAILGRPTPDGGAAQVWLPFEWRGLTVHAPGAQRLRVRMQRPEPDTMRVSATDEHGRPVITLDSLRLRAVPSNRLRVPGAPADRPLLTLEWSAVDDGPAVTAEVADLAVLDHIASRWSGTGLEQRRFADLDALRRHLDDDGGPAPTRVLAWLPGPAQAPDAVPEQVLVATTAALALVHSWLADGRFVRSRLVVLTRGATAEDPDLDAAAVCGLLRSAQSEHPDRLAVVDVDDAAASLAALPGLLAADHEQLAVRAGTGYVPGLQPLSAQRGDVAVNSAIADGTVLVTGGLGGLGALVTRHLVTVHGVRSLLLLGRSGPDTPDATGLVADLDALGAEVSVLACDVTDRDALAAALATIPAERPLRAVLHLAGSTDDGAVTGLDAARMRAVVAPKVAGAWHLHELTANADLAAFVLFSSAAGVLGAPGQGNYAAANAALDALAAHRAARGLPALSLAWGPWSADVGMSGRLTDADRARMRRAGLVALDTDEALAMLDVALAGPASTVVPLRVDAGLLRAAQRSTVPAVLRSLLPAEPRGHHSADAARLNTTWSAQLAAAPGPDREPLLRKLVGEQVALVIGHRGSAPIDPDIAFAQLGFDSLTAVELRNRLGRMTGMRLPATLIFDYPTVAALTAHLGEHLLAVPGPDISATGLVDELERVFAENTAVENHILDRLRALVDRARTNGDGGRVAAPGDDVPLHSAALSSTSDDDLFQIIGARFGIADPPANGTPTEQETTDD